MSDPKDNEAAVSKLAADTRQALLLVARRFVGTDDFEGAREALRRELETYIEIYHSVGLLLHVKRVETLVHPNGRGIVVRFYDGEGRQVRV